MTVADLIRELQAMPQQLPVRVVTAEVTVATERSEYTVDLEEYDAMEADSVRHMGPYVLVRST